MLLGKPAQRSFNVRLVVRQGLGCHPDAGVMQLANRDPDRGPAGGDDRERTVQPLGDLPRRADPVPSVLSDSSASCSMSVIRSTKDGSKSVVVGVAGSMVVVMGTKPHRTGMDGDGW